MSVARDTPHEHSMSDAVGKALDGLAHHFPFWVPHLNSVMLGAPIGEVENTPEKFGFALEVCHFLPDEVKVNVNGNELTVEGKHEEKDDGHGRVQRSFTRKYPLPDDVNVKSVRSFINKDGHLIVEAMKRTAELDQSRAIPITKSEK